MSGLGNAQDPEAWRDLLGDVRQQAQDMASELTHLREVHRQVEVRMSGITMLLRTYVEMFPSLLPMVHDIAGFIGAESESSQTDDIPRGSEAVREVLQSVPGESWLVSELVRALDDRGWLPPGSANPANAVRTAVERLVAMDDSDIIKTDRSGRVAYSYRPDHYIEMPLEVIVNDPDEEPF